MAWWLRLWRRNRRRDLFVISGFLVSGSVARRSTLDYLASRALRILPALAVVTCFEVLLIGPIFTTLPVRAYFSNSATWNTSPIR